MKCWQIQMARCTAFAEHIVRRLSSDISPFSMGKTGVKTHAADLGSCLFCSLYVLFWLGFVCLLAKSPWETSLLVSVPWMNANNAVWGGLYLQEVQQISHCKREWFHSQVFLWRHQLRFTVPSLIPTGKSSTFQGGNEKKKIPQAEWQKCRLLCMHLPVTS